MVNIIQIIEYNLVHEGIYSESEGVAFIIRELLLTLVRERYLIKVLLIYTCEYV